MNDITLYSVLKDIAQSIRINSNLTDTDDNKIIPINFGNRILLLASDSFAPTIIDTNGRGLSNIKTLKINGDIAEGKIEKSAFKEMGIVDLELGEGVISIGEYAFYKCTNLENVTFSNTLERIEAYSFAYCTKIKSLVIPSSVNHIGNAFICCSRLESFDVSPENPKYKADGNAIIEENGTFKEYDIEQGKLVIRSGAVFVLGGKLSTIPDYIRHLGSCCFYGMLITNISLHEGLLSIGDSAFRSSNIAELSIPSTVTTIGIQAFEGVKCQKIVIPDTVLYIGGYLFQSCPYLTEVTYSKKLKSVPTGTFKSCTKLSKLVIPDDSDLVKIESEAFYGCSALTELIFPQSITSISGSAFTGCTSMLKYDFTKLTAVPTLSSSTAFTGANDNMRIVVPDNLYDSWIDKTNWVTYKSRIIKSSEYTES